MTFKTLRLIAVFLAFGVLGFFAMPPEGPFEPDHPDFELESGLGGGSTSNPVLESKNVKCGDWLKSCSKNECNPGSTTCGSTPCRDNRSGKSC